MSSRGEWYTLRSHSRVSFAIEPVGEMVRLTVTHDLLKPGSNTLKAITNGSGGSVLFPIRATRMINKNYKPAQGTFEGLCHYFNLIEDLASTAEISTPS